LAARALNVWLTYVRLLVREMVERWDEEALGKVAGCAEDDQRARRRRRRIDEQRAVSRQLY
jgi:hypothetical protein